MHGIHDPDPHRTDDEAETKFVSAFRGGQGRSGDDVRHDGMIATLLWLAIIAIAGMVILDWVF